MGQYTNRDATDETFATRITAARARHFVGRDDEVQRWRAFISPENEQPLWFITGSGGMGKTMLLRLFQADAMERGLHMVYVDASQIPPNPVAVNSMLSSATMASSPTESGMNMPPLLLIDGFEYWQTLEAWFRQTFLPAQSASLKIVVASRCEPSLEWYTDAGWRSLVAMSVLPRLTESECRAYLWRRRVAKERQRHLITCSGGHPLALAVATDTLLDETLELDLAADVGEELIQPLEVCLTRDAVTMDQRHALDAAVVVRELNETLLARMLAVEDASALFAWLSRQPSMESRESGIAPNDLTRETLMRAMPGRSPGRYECLARNATEWVAERLETSSALTWDSAASLAEDALYALRAAPMARHFTLVRDSVPDRCTLNLDRWRPGDEAVIQPMIIGQLGEESLYWFRFWHQRVPHGVIVVRDTEQQPVAFFLKLDMESLDPEAREADPLTRKLWQALDTQFNLHPGDHIPFIRHWVVQESAVRSSAAKARMLSATHGYNLAAKNLRLSAQVVDEAFLSEAAAAALGIQLLPGSDTAMDGRYWRIYYNDWARESPARYYRELAGRVLDHDPNGFTQTSTNTTIQWSGAPATLDETAFACACIKALKQFHRPEKLCDNDLLSCALVSVKLGERCETADRIEGLRACLEAAVDMLADSGPTGRRQARVLRAAYFDPVNQDQKTAAATRHMGYSTFRRHLVQAREALAGELWRLEKSEVMCLNV